MPYGARCREPGDTGPEPVFWIRPSATTGRFRFMMRVRIATTALVLSGALLVGAPVASASPAPTAVTAVTAVQAGLGAAGRHLVDRRPGGHPGLDGRQGSQEQEEKEEEGRLRGRADHRPGHHRRADRHHRAPRAAAEEADRLRTAPKGGRHPSNPFPCTAVHGSIPGFEYTTPVPLTAPGEPTPCARTNTRWVDAVCS